MRRNKCSNLNVTRSIPGKFYENIFKCLSALIYEIRYSVNGKFFTALDIASVLI